jgi:very-short-patch-repair endonuclease
MTISTREDLIRALNRDRVIAIHREGAVPGVVRRAIRNRDLVAVLPGVYASAATATEPLVRMTALQQRHPDTVFTGLSAAGLLWNSVRFPGVVSATGRIAARRGFDLTRRTVDPEWIVTVHGLRCTRPELTAIDLIPEHGGEYIDLALRAARGRGRQVLNRMWQALEAHSDRRNNKLRRAVLTESRDLPWSAAERLAHAGLRGAGITGWAANFPVHVRTVVFHLDIAFPPALLAVEIDGYRFHSSRDAFELDRQRQNALVCVGWTVLRFTWAMLQDDTWLATIRQCIERAR